MVEEHLLSWKRSISGVLWAASSGNSPSPPFSLVSKPAHASSEYQEILSWREVDMIVKLIGDLCLIPRLKICEAVPPHPCFVVWCLTV